MVGQKAESLLQACSARTVIALTGMRCIQMEIEFILYGQGRTVVMPLRA